MTINTFKNKHRAASILMVEDSPGDVLIMKRAFKHARLPYELNVATTGEQALSVLRREGDYAAAPRPDIILLDINLPKMSGKDVLSIVKSDDRFRRIPVVMVSSSCAETDVMGSYDLHANSYVVKPSSLEESITLIETIEQFWFTLAVLPSVNDQSPPA